MHLVYIERDWDTREVVGWWVYYQEVELQKPNNYFQWVEISDDDMAELLDITNNKYQEVINKVIQKAQFSNMKQKYERNDNWTMR